jgi:xanthine/CO dehydrogenase XdhC/CoxF family maturation factor
VPVGARLALGEAGELSSTLADEPASAALSWAARSALGETHPKSRIVHGEGFEALLEVIQPAPQLFLFGAGPDAVPVVEFSRAVGFEITVCEANPRPAVRERFAHLAELYTGSVESVLPKIEARRSALGVVMSHHYPTDLRALALLLESRASYIGVLGPERRTRRMLCELHPNRQPAEADLARIRAPIGLDLGSETPTQIALSIVAEMQAVLARASAEPLSLRSDRPIHAASPELTVTGAGTARLARTGTQ